MSEVLCTGDRRFIIFGKSFALDKTIEDCSGDLTSSTNCSNSKLSLGRVGDGHGGVEVSEECAMQHRHWQEV